MFSGRGRLLREGTPGRAVVLSSEWKRFDVKAGRLAHRLTLEVHYADGTTARIERSVSALEVGGAHTVGDVLPVRYDPADHTDVEIDVPALKAAQRSQDDLLGEKRIAQARASLAPAGEIGEDPEAERLTAEWLERLVRLTIGHADGAVGDGQYQAGLTAARNDLRDGTAIRATGEEADFVAAIARAVIGDPIGAGNAVEVRRAARLLEGSVRLKLRRESGELDDEQYRAAQAAFGEQARQFD